MLDTYFLILHIIYESYIISLFLYVTQIFLAMYFLSYLSEIEFSELKASPNDHQFSEPSPTL